MRPDPKPIHEKIAERAKITTKVGDQPLWEGYGQGAATRTPDQVKTQPEMGLAYSQLIEQIRPAVVVEFGTAFGMSGMYWLAGLELNGSGHLYTFDPNQVWADLARENLSAISDRFTLTIGTFEDNVGILPGPIDFAFIDAIHTSDFVKPQFDIVASRSGPGASWCSTTSASPETCVTAGMLSRSIPGCVRRRCSAVGSALWSWPEGFAGKVLSR
ncbi:O-methyltransferase [Mycolicibacterium aichiense]|uniref:O-methyltransferase n=1 Tax=Mycolicibacterium aichiense TaxID=1799 RepID=UPI003D6687FA